MLKIAVIIIIAAVIAVSSITIIQVRSGINQDGYNPFSNAPVALIEGNATNRSTNVTFGSNMVTIGLWNLKSGDGNTMMSIYQNSSVHTILSFSNLETYSNTVAGYPSIQFSHNLLIPVATFDKGGYSSFASFDFKNATLNLPVDCTYDLWMTNNPTTLQPNAEVMIWLYWTNPLIQTKSYTSVSIPTLVNGTQFNVTWYVNEGYWNGHDYPTFVFFPSISISPKMTYGISLSTFLLSLQHVMDMNLTNSYVKSIDIGTEFGSPVWVTEYLDVWLTSYLIINGQKDTITGGID